MRDIQKKIHTVATILIALVVCIGGYLVYRVANTSHATDDQEMQWRAEKSIDNDAEAEESITETTTSHPAPDPPPPVKDAPLYKRYNRRTEWNYDDCVVADRLNISGVSRIPAGILVDPESGKVLWAKHSQEKKEIASMTKMMTLLIAIEAVRDGKIDLEDEVTVSRAAAGIGGSQVYLAEGEVFTVRELLKTIIVVSANDSSYLIAETIGGDTDTFVSMMNKKAAELGMNDTTFHNMHGLPLKGQKNISTAYDMALLADAMHAYPLVHQWASIWIDYFRDGKFMMVNHNKLVKHCDGVNGLKTGYYRNAGFCVTATATREGKRLIAVVIGIKMKSDRNAFVSKLLDWGYAQSGVR